MLVNFLPLRCAFLGLLFGHVMANHTAANRPDDGMVTRIMSGYTTYYCAFQAACGVSRPGRCETQSRSGEQHRHSMSFETHV
jgi:hypothetical protein